MQELSTQDIELIKTANRLKSFKEFLGSDVRTVFGKKPPTVMDRIRNAGDRTKEFLTSDVRTVFGRKPTVMGRVRDFLNSDVGTVFGRKPTSTLGKIREAGLKRVQNIREGVSHGAEDVQKKLKDAKQFAIQKAQNIREGVSHGAEAVQEKLREIKQRIAPKANEPENGLYSHLMKHKLKYLAGAGAVGGLGYAGYRYYNNKQDGE